MVPHSNTSIDMPSLITSFGHPNLQGKRASVAVEEVVYPAIQDHGAWSAHIRIA